MGVVLAQARDNLNKTVFFGISDYWNTTVCLFHKELKGPGPRPSEFVNVRKGGGAVAGTTLSSPAKTAKAAGGSVVVGPTHSRGTLSDRELNIITNGTAVDVQLFREALRHFKNRAKRYGCPMVPST